jgi:hypothetical protein
VCVALCLFLQFLRLLFDFKHLSYVLLVHWVVTSLEYLLRHAIVKDKTLIIKAERPT